MNYYAWRSLIPSRNPATCGTASPIRCGSRGEREPRRPARIEVRRKAFQTAWKAKLKQIDVECVLSDTLDVDRHHAGPLAGAATAEARAGRSRRAEDPEGLLALPQEPADVWQADIRPCRTGSRAKGNPIGRGGDGGQPDGRFGVRASTGAGASARRMVVGGRPSGRPATGDGRPASPRPDRGGVCRAASRPCCRTWSGPASSVLPWSGSNTWTPCWKHGAALGRTGRVAFPVGRAGDATGGGGQLLRGGGRFLPPQGPGSRCRATRRSRSSATSSRAGHGTRW